MRPTLTHLTCTAALLITLPCFGLTHSHHTYSSPLHRASFHTHAFSRAALHSHSRTVVHHDPVPSMDPDRATAIQSALIRSGYLTGEPTGAWDATSIAAMQKLQADNGWPTKFVPDARALIKLGLGPQPAQ
jgi:hypothetical protein